MSEYKNTAAAALEWSDVSLYAVKWSQDGRDLLLELDFPRMGLATLLCSWARNVEIQVISKENEGGPPLSWDASFKQLAKTGWNICLDFADRGQLSLECTELILKCRIRS